MGKILSYFDIGFAGAISRSVDDVVVSLKNAGTDPIPFGAPVFLTDSGEGVVGFVTGGSQTFERFVGFAVRSAGKTPAMLLVASSCVRFRICRKISGLSTGSGLPSTTCPK